MKKKIVAFTLSVLLLGTISYPAMATSTTELNDQKNEIQEKINETKEKQSEVKEELNSELKEISTLDASISEVEAQISNLESEISSLEDSIEEKQKELEEKQKEHDKNQALMEERLVVMYESGETTFLDMVFGSRNLIEFISNYYTLSQITECDRELLDTIEKEQEQIENTKKELEDEKERVDSAKTEKEAKNNILKAKKSERQQKANALSEENKQLQSDIDSYNAQVDKIEAQIKQIMEDLRRKQEEEAKKNGSSGSSSGTTGLKFDGSFIWPCNNKVVTSTVKTRWGRLHKGIDIGADHEPVYASASGYAYSLENPGGYGHYIMIIHGDGYITLYGHLLSRNISYGQYVKQGQVIATSGGGLNDEGRGSSTGRHLHFEIRKASSLSNFFSVSPLNPLDYLPGGYTFAAGAKTPS